MKLWCVSVLVLWTYGVGGSTIPPCITVTGAIRCSRKYGNPTVVAELYGNYFNRLADEIIEPVRQQRNDIYELDENVEAEESEDQPEPSWELQLSGCFPMKPVNLSNPARLSLTHTCAKNGQWAHKDIYINSDDIHDGLFNFGDVTLL